MVELSKGIIDCYQTIAQDYSHPERERYLRFQANIRKIFGIDVDEKAFMEFMEIHQQNIDFMKLKQFPSWAHVIQPQKTPKQAIYVTLHIGLYTSIIYLLVSQGISICVPVTRRVFEQQRGLYEACFDQAIKPGSANLHFVNIEEPAGLFKLFRDVKKGYSLLFYIDGNSGIGGMERKDDKLQPVDFFNKVFYVRKGLGFFSYKFNLDIQPLYSYVDGQQQVFIKYLPVLHLKRTGGIDDYEKAVTCKIWETFKSAISEYLPQWEGWLYADTYLRDRPVIDTSTITGNSFHFNKSRFAPIIKDHVNYLYDRYNNVLIKMSDTLFGLILKILESKESLSLQEIRDIIGKPTLIEDLLNYNILVN